MSSKNLRDRVNYLTSLRLLTSDKYGIWRLDPLGVLFGILLLLWGIVEYNIPGPWRIAMITCGAILLSVCSLRIERRYTHFRNEIFRDLENMRHS